MEKPDTLNDIEDLKTGDIVLFNYQGHNPFFILFSYLIYYTTNSSFTHAAMILKDPTFINPSLKGIYLWESGSEPTPDQEDGKTKLGVQITSFHDVFYNYPGKLYVRKLKKGHDQINNQILSEIHNEIYNKPYDLVPRDWLGAWTRKDSNPQKTDRFWCSALVAYILVRLGYLSKETDWSIIRPSDLSSNFNYLTFLPGCQYGDDICLK